MLGLFGDQSPVNSETWTWGPKSNFLCTWGDASVLGRSWVDVQDVQNHQDVQNVQDAQDVHDVQVQEKIKNSKSLQRFLHS